MDPQIDRRHLLQLNRRQLLRAGGALTLAALVPACSSGSGDGGNGATPSAPPEGGTGEAPGLKALVDSGELPPLAERLPASPMVVQPIEEIGQYGGTWRNGMVGTDGGRLIYTLAYENLVRWNLDWTEPIPNVAEAVEINDDATVYTFILREGMKWSDGAPFTADDILFAYNDVLTHPQVNPGDYGLFVAGGEMGTLEKVDDVTVVFTFAAPHALFLEQLAGEIAYMPTRLPRHYLEKFHPDYSDDAEQNAKDADFSGWVEALQDALWGGAMWHDIELPRLHAWVPTTPVSDATEMLFERNPYYWKIDPDGNQLPYLDGIRFGIFQDAEVLLLSTLQGEIDMIDRVVTTTTNKPVLARDRESGGYDFFDLVPDKINTMTILLNQNCQDEVKREIFGNKDFRIGLSHAINRQEIIEAVYARQGEPWQPAPLPESALYDEEMGKQYTEYDVDLANRHLDDAGYTERNADGIRLGPDGKPISFRILVATDSGKPEMIDSLELVKGYWREVGIDMSMQTEANELRYELIQANEHEAHVWDGDGALDPVNSPSFYLPRWGIDNVFASKWSNWLDGDTEDGIEPPEPVKEQFRIYQEVLVEPDPDRRNELMAEVLRIAKEQFYLIGISTPVPPYGVVKNNFRNMVDQTFFAAKFPYPGVTHPEQYFVT
ncbi:ABC transporter substrate-binding protein [Phytoactinopolyspora halotolerans]|uniref:ABC transporter substrate-binding protein n=1 Tax=Phytoactinopolyspora halotolerans TaxID=1981512 RepID=A0A6L9S9E1_9ACTN|nr:ABC transporter substrate-binding protein [Phytoactinopolyspora halotolerans]NEE01653.1 ABC transporter substrate-binding protein [Phytoactinopolyspora halotolerans]